MTQSPPSARLLIATGCNHCAATLEGLIRLVKAGRLSALEIVNLSVSPGHVRDSDGRSVPVTRVGPFRLEGALTPDELSDWVEAVSGGGGWAAYYAHLLDRQRLDEVLERLRERRSGLAELLSLLASEETAMTTRIGIGAVIEELAGSARVRAVIPDLVQLTLSESHQTRADACHYLGLTGDASVVPAVRRLLGDEREEVREIASETLAMLGADEAGGPETAGGEA
jgi:hypothetical protein